MVGGLFTDYVNTLLKIKQEASSWQDWCQTENETHSYIHLCDKKGRGTS